MKHIQLSDELQEKALLYASGAMSEEERREYIRHLEEDDCGVCRSESLEFLTAAQSLALSVPQETPSPVVKTRLMAQAEAVARPAVAPPVKQRGLMERLGWLVAVAAASLLMFVFFRNSTLQQQVESLIVRVMELESQMDREQAIVASLTDPAVRISDLQGPGGAGARIFQDERVRQWRIYVNGLPPAPAGRDYQLWFLPKTGNPISAHVFNTMPDGTVSAVVPVPPDVTDLMAAAVTNEPAGGSPQPTNTDFVLSGALE